MVITRGQLWKHIYGEATSATCQCGFVFHKDTSQWHRAHIVAKNKSGTNELNNYCIVCATCNLRCKTENQLIWSAKHYPTAQMKVISDLIKTLPKNDQYGLIGSLASEYNFFVEDDEYIEPELHVTVVESPPTRKSKSVCTKSFQDSPYCADHAAASPAVQQCRNAKTEPRCQVLPQSGSTYCSHCFVHSNQCATILSRGPSKGERCLMPKVPGSDYCQRCASKQPKICKYVHSEPPLKGQSCSNRTEPNSEYCFTCRHNVIMDQRLKDREDEEREYIRLGKCKYVFVRGEKKGQQCSRLVHPGSDYCSNCMSKKSVLQSDEE